MFCSFLRVLFAVALVASYDIVTVYSLPVVILPNTLWSGLDASISSHNVDVPITVRLLGEDGTEIPGSSVSIAPHEEAQTVTFSVPQDLSAGDNYVVQISADSWNNESRISVEPADFFLLIELDKLVYKPGQKIRARVLSVDPHLKASAGKDVVVELRNPKSFIINRWEITLDDKGFGSVEYDVSADPILGDYTLTAMALEGAVQASQSLEIDEYVLPKFEVTVEVDQDSLSSNTEEISGTVEAIYTYGENVEGQVEIEVLYKPSSSWSPWIRMAPMVIGGFAAEGSSGVTGGGRPAQLNVLASTAKTIDGRTDFTFTLDELRSGGLNSFYGSVVVRARVIETATQETQAGTSEDVGLRNQDFKLELTGPPFFQPGLGYQVDVAVLKSAEDLEFPSSISLEVYLGTNQGSYSGTSSLDTRPTVNIDPVTGQNSEPLILQIPVDDSTCCPAAEVEGESRNPWDYPRDCCINSLNINLQNWDGERYDYQTVSSDYLSPQRSSSPSNHYLQLRQTEGTGSGVVSFKYALTSSSASPHWVVLGKLGVVAAGVAPAVPAGTTGSLDVPVDVLSFAPTASLMLFYITDDGEMVADQVTISTEGVLNHQVTAGFSQTEVEPGVGVDINLGAADDARVYYLAVDKSVLLQSGGRSSALTVDKLFSGVETSFHPGLSEEEECYTRVAATVLAVSGARAVGPFQLPSCDPSRGGVWGGGFGIEMAMMVGDAAESSAVIREPSGTTAESTSEVRREFPEAWLWSHEEMNGRTSAVIQDQAPDTITSWALTAFATSPTQGYGVADGSSELKVFKPFFASLLLPYSIVRGETATLNVGLFNYLNSDGTVTVALSEEFAEDGSPLLEVVGSATQTVGVAADSSSTVTFQVRGRGLGTASVRVDAQSSVLDRSDAVVKTMLVKAQGAEKVVVANAVVQLDGGSNTETMETLTVTLPPASQRVDGSDKSKITVIGDMMGPSIEGLERLLQVPTGCGEQNMIGLAPNVYVLNYLKATNGLTPQVESRALKNMEQGYQRELNYQHPDDSFSAFGETDPSGSTWLTAFVLKVFSQSSPHIFVDSNLTSAVADWLLNRQQEDGSFESVGEVIHKEMQGGAASGVSLTAYVLIALLHAGASDSSAVTEALQYLEEQNSPGVQDNYATVISTYARALACASEGLTLDCSTLSADVDAMMALAVTEGGLSHFEPSPAEEQGNAGLLFAPDPYISRQASASFIEITSYAALALVAAGRAGSAFPVVRWLLLQRNSLGGFSSTQDTALALEALATYGAQIYASGGESSVSVMVSHSGGTEGGALQEETFTVDGGNFAVLQRRDLPPGTDTVEVLAQCMPETCQSGTALIQLTASYNVYPEVTSDPFTLTTEWSPIEGVPGVHLVADVRVTLNEGALKGNSRESGMVIVEVNAPSGHTPTSSSMQALVGQHMVKRVEYSPGGAGAHIYLQALTVGHQVRMTLHASRGFEVLDIQNPICMAQMYYEPETSTIVEAALRSQNLEELPDSGVDVNAPPSPPTGSPPAAESDSSSMSRTPTCMTFIVHAALMFVAVLVMSPLMME